MIMKLEARENAIVIKCSYLVIKNNKRKTAGTKVSIYLYVP